MHMRQGPFNSGGVKGATLVNEHRRRYSFKPRAFERAGAMTQRPDGSVIRTPSSSDLPHARVLDTDCRDLPVRIARLRRSKMKMAVGDCPFEAPDLESGSPSSR